LRGEKNCLPKKQTGKATFIFAKTQKRIFPNKAILMHENYSERNFSIQPQNYQFILSRVYFEGFKVLRPKDFRKLNISINGGFFKMRV